MDRAILFRFHKNKDVCKKQISLLKHLNPDCKIFGLGEHIEGEDDLLEAGLEDIYVISDKPKRWKWLNGDLAIRKWFQDTGNNQPFDMLHVVEWDLVITKPLKEVYSHVPKEGVAMSGVIPVEKARKYGWDWVTGNSLFEYNLIKDYAEDNWSKSNNYKAGILPGASFSRMFLEEYSNVEDVPEICNDEVRVGVFGEAMGCGVYDTGFYNGWGSDGVSDIFNSMNSEIPLETVYNTNHTAYHPVREPIDIEKLDPSV